ncbi:SDR family NAD(P)-dependent oxidoreductase [Streptomyces sp. NPDC001717]|uniref:SDR family NAD(P)-dependent oxidoreductase n=1 Tax=Streptomyces sp. NPDC001717 TaxID=3364604 RepID=UPI003686E3A1
MGTTALITGASSGLGAEFAAQLAARGHDLVLVARSADRLAALAERLGDAHGVQVHVLVQDLAQPDAARRIGAELTDRALSVDVLVNNAGFGTCGRFEQIDGRRDHDQLMVNVVSLVDLTHELLPGMLERGRGSVINVASTAAFQPTPYFAVYGASKTFVLDFSLALRQEYRRRGIRVLALCPGPVETGFFDVIGTRKAAVTGSFSLPEPVVRSALRALDADRAYVTPGLSNAVSAHLTPRRPRTMVAAIAERVSRGVRDARQDGQRTAV